MCVQSHAAGRGRGSINNSDNIKAFLPLQSSSNGQNLDLLLLYEAVVVAAANSWPRERRVGRCCVCEAIKEIVVAVGPSYVDYSLLLSLSLFVVAVVGCV